MHDRFADRLTLDDFADVGSFSPYHFNRVFRQIMGIPPGEYLAALRLDAAKRLLMTTSLDVAAICTEVGYTSLGSFTTRFTHTVGVSPAALRRLANTCAPIEPEMASQYSDAAPLPSENVPGLSGHIRIAAPFKGLIFAGLYPRPIPQSFPVACTNLYAPGAFHIAPVPDGQYYLLSAALPWSFDPRTFVVPPPDARFGISPTPVLIRGGMAQSMVDLELRPRHITDPPLLVAPLALLGHRLAIKTLLR
ncbi:MAG: helix-turn-helix transcriptional regulator [Chloroflexales bacterium]|nr:helix-turn-helix transcriptional regulator [Chloroflexales bacterium]